MADGEGAGQGSGGAPEGQRPPRPGPRYWLVLLGIGLIAYFTSLFLTAGVLRSASFLLFLGLGLAIMALLSYLAWRLGLLGRPTPG